MKKNKNKWLDFKVFSVKIYYLVLIIFIAVLAFVINPSNLYISFGVVGLVALVMFYICIKEIKNRKDRIVEL